MEQKPSVLVSASSGTIARLVARACTQSSTAMMRQDALRGRDGDAHECAVLTGGVALYDFIIIPIAGGWRRRACQTRKRNPCQRSQGASSAL